jgi:elongation factor G
MNEPVSPVRRPLVWTKLRPVSNDCEELRRALAKLSEEDAAFSVDDEDVAGQVIIRAMSELHLEVICERLAREHNVYVECGKSEIIYLETIRDTSATEGKFISQSGGRGYYAHVVIRIEPNPAKGYELVNETPKGAIPDKYLNPIDQGIRYALTSGVGDHEMIDIKVTLCDGSYHEADSDEAAFETAGFMAMKEAVRQSRPVLMEPVISLEVVVPQQLTGSVVSDLKLRRVEVTGIEGREGEQVIHAIARLAEIIGHVTDLRSITQERATYSAALLCYRQVQDLPPAGDDRVGVTANKPRKPKPKRGAEAVEPPWLESDC